MIENLIFSKSHKGCELMNYKRRCKVKNRKKSDIVKKRISTRKEKTIRKTYSYHEYLMPKIADKIGSGTIGSDGSPWTLYDDGVLEIGAGFINWTSFLSPWQCYNEILTHIIITGPIIAKNDLSGLFSHLIKLKRIDGLDLIDTSRVRNMSYLFSGLRLKSLDLSRWDTQNVISMDRTFACAEIDNLKITNWSTISLWSIAQMFYNFKTEELDLSHWNISNLWDTYYVFEGAEIKRLDLSNWDTRNIQDIIGMFKNANISELLLTNWNLSQTVRINDLFKDATIKNIELTNALIPVDTHIT